MKRTFLNVLAVAGVLFGGSLTASAAEHLRVNVPFSFVVAGLEFQPGQYTLAESNSGLLTVSGEGRGAMVLTLPAELRANAPSALHFVTDGHAYHLVGVQMEGEADRAISSPVYREHKLSISR